MSNEDRAPRSEAKRAQIRAAAQMLFLQRGFGATTMDAITATAGISKQTLYRYYPGKEALFADILDQMTLQRETVTPWPPFASSITSRADFEAVLLWLARDITADVTRPAFVALLRVMIAEMPRFPHLTTLYHTTVRDPGLAAVSRLIEQARTAGIVVIPETTAAVRLYIGSLLSFLLIDGLFADETAQLPTDEQLTAIVRLFVRAVT